MRWINGVIPFLFICVFIYGVIKQIQLPIPSIKGCSSEIISIPLYLQGLSFFY